MAELDVLRTAYRRARSESTADHLSEAQWERLACDELVNGERQLALDHILECPRCSDIYRAVLALRDEAATFDEGAPPPYSAPRASSVSRFPWRRGLGGLALAATVLLVLVLPMRRSHQPDTGQEGVVVRSVGTADPVARQLAPSDPVPWASGDNVVLSWTPSSSSRPVFVEVLDEAGELVWTSPETTGGEARWPGEAVPGPGRYYWRVVSAESLTGGSASELVSFELGGE